MDGPGPLLTALRAALAPFDDAALAALASKGLVRRARNDVATTPPAVLGPDGGGGGVRLRVAVGDATALLTLPPSQSSCTCPAAGVCRHVLAALIFVRESGPLPDTEGTGAAPGPSAVAEILAVDDGSLARWAGKALVARASRSLAFGPPAEIEEAGAVVVRFPGRNVTCRWMPGGGLAGTLCSCHAPAPCQHRVAAVLAVQAARGARDLAGAAAALEPPADAPRTRDEVRASLGSVLAAVVTSGTSRVSRATADRLRTLAVSAHGVDLPRLERLVRTLADEVELALARHAQADPARLLAAAARADVLRVALARPTPALVGAHRSHYEPAGEIELVGLGARAWQTRSGYAGLTVYFWDRSARTWSTWTDARPTTLRTTAGGGFDPRARYLTAGPWSGLPNPSHASRHVLRLTGAYRNRSGRLSGRPSTTSFDTGPSDPTEAPAVVRWTDLIGRAARLFGGGLGDRTEGDALVRLAPADWSPAAFDPIRQEIVRAVTDADGRSLPLVLAETPENRAAVAALESFLPAPSDSLLGLLKLDAGRLCVEPVALYTGSKVVSLTLDTLRTSPARRPPSATPPDAAPAPPTTPLGVLLSRLSGLLESIGEGGFAAFRDLDALRDVTTRADAIGLSVCALPASRVVAHLERLRLGDPDATDRPAQDLLRAYHVAGLALAHESIAAATAGLGPSVPGTLLDAR